VQLLLKWLKRFTLGLLTLVVVLRLLGATYQAAAGKADEKNFPHPGQLIDVGSYKMHIYCKVKAAPL